MSQSISAVNSSLRPGSLTKPSPVTPVRPPAQPPPAAAGDTGAASVLDQISRQWAQLNSRLQTRIAQMGGPNGELLKVQMDVNSINLTTQAATQLGEGLSQTVKRLAQATNG